ncbi:hypothetical protein JOF34_000396 [Microbacterium amylolyticum]|uniref:Uncharacterized protein n=1 Tax=Microbacterium amylolyticum TaxID=936337 RepID=A0ABS4ZFP5_9MICO|nr:hypothetical protein [Microbacterium amylolyticum]
MSDRLQVKLSTQQLTNVRQVGLLSVPLTTVSETGARVS